MRKQLALGSCLALAMGPTIAHAGISQQGTNAQGVSVQGVSVQGVSIQGTSIQGTSVQGASIQGASIQGASIQGVSVQGVSIQGASVQGVSIQGSSIQGASIQGSSVQGVSIQGTSIQGVSIQGVSVQGVSIQGVSIQGVGIQGFAPESVLLPPGGGHISGAFSLLGGALNGETLNAVLDGSQLTGTVGSTGYFVAGDGLLGAALAFYPNGDATELPLLVFVRDYTIDADTNSMVSGIDPLNGDNSDIHLYRLTAPMLVLDEVTDADGNTSIEPVGYVELNLCGSDEDGVTDDDYGMFFDGVPTYVGYMDAGGQSFACRSGTMNKAARSFGYKPWKDYSVAESGTELWTAMWNGAMANYCMNTEESFTVDGTLVDVEDPYGLNLKTAENDPYSFATESDWNMTDGRTVPLSRLYQARQVDQSWAGGVFCGESQTLFEEVNELVSGVRIHTSRLCPHAPNDTGGPLNRLCSPCVQTLYENLAMDGAYSECFSLEWGAHCVAAAETFCATDAETADASGYYGGYANVTLF